MGFFSFGGGGGGGPTQARNPKRVYVPLHTADGIQCTASNGSNNVGPYQIVGSPSVDLSGLELTVFSPSSNAARYQVLIRKNGTDIIVPNLSVRLNTSGITVIDIPIKVAANDDLDIAIRSSSNGTTMRFSVNGVAANSLDSPGFDTMTGLTLDTANTRGGNVVVTDNSTWVELVAATAALYGALSVMISPDANSTSGQRNTLVLATGVSGFEVEFWRHQYHVSASAPYVGNANFLIEQEIPSGSRISAMIIPGNAGVGDTFRPGLWGFA